MSAYVELLSAEREPATVKQHVAAIRGLFDWLVIGGIVPINPASSVRTPRMSYRKGKTPILDAGECRLLLDSIDITKISGLRDRALIGVMVYSFARIGATLKLNRGDYWSSPRKVDSESVLTISKKSVDCFLGIFQPGRLKSCFFVTLVGRHILASDRRMAPTKADF